MTPLESGTPSSAPTVAPSDARWPARLVGLARALRPPDGTPSGRDRETFWLLVNTVLHQKIRIRAGGSGGFSGAEIEDLASAKLLDLLGQYDSGRWDPAESSPGEVAGFLTAVARNAVVDSLRSRARRFMNEEEAIDQFASLESPTRAGAEPPEESVERAQFAETLRRCASRLGPRDRTIWMLRALLELSSRDIAAHPAVRLRTDHVDVILQRCRQRLGECMRASGHEITRLPAGTFATLWETFGGLPGEVEEP